MSNLIAANRTFDDKFDYDLHRLKVNPTPIKYFGHEIFDKMAEYDHRDFCLSILNKGVVGNWRVSSSNSDAIWGDILKHYSLILGREDIVDFNNGLASVNTETWAHIGRVLALRQIKQTGEDYVRESQFKEKTGPKTERLKSKRFIRFYLYVLIKTQLWRMKLVTDLRVSPERAFSYILESDAYDNNLGVRVFDVSQAKTDAQKHAIKKRNALRAWVSDYAGLEASMDTLKESIKEVRREIGKSVSFEFNREYSQKNMEADRDKVMRAIYDIQRREEDQRWQTVYNYYRKHGQSKLERDRLQADYESYWKARNVTFEKRKGN